MTLSLGNRFVCLMIHYRISRLILAAAALSLGACSNPQSVVQSGDRVHLKGQIDQNMANKFASLDLATANTVVITSSGGNSLPALEISQMIVKHGLNVEARDVCASACASYIFVAGNGRTVAPNTLLAFHSGSAAFLDLYDRVPEDLEEVEPGERLLLANRLEQELYQSVGADINLLRLSTALRGLQCFRVRKRANGTSAIEPAYLATGFAPTKSILESYGIEVSGDNLPKTVTDLKAIAKFQFGAPENIPLIMLPSDEDSALTAEEISSRILWQNFRPCEDGLS